MLTNKSGSRQLYARNTDFDKIYQGVRPCADLLISDPAPGSAREPEMQPTVETRRWPAGHHWDMQSRGSLSVT
jgi:hypothetical protein